MDILRRGLRPRQIVTRAAIENAIAGVNATGGSTNAVLHLLAIAREAGVPLTIDDFDPIGRRTPLWADMQPGGRYTAVDLGRAGGTAIVAKRLVDAKLADTARDHGHRPHVRRGGRTGARDARPGRGAGRSTNRSSRPAGWSS